MKQRFGLAAIFLSILAASLATLPARADEPASTSDVAGNQSAETPMDTSDAESAADLESDASPDADSETPKPPPTAKEMYDGLIAISPPGGWQLPPAPEKNQSDWKTIAVGFASMKVPPDWTVQNQIGKQGDEDQTIGLAPPSNDIYIELRQIQNADSNYEQTAQDHAQSDYRNSPDRLKDGVILGFQPMVIDGAVGSVEIMNQFGKDKNADGTPTFRMISWRGRWQQNDAIQRVEFTATFAQDRYEQVAPMVSAVLATVNTNNGEPAK